MESASSTLRKGEKKAGVLRSFKLFDYFFVTVTVTDLPNKLRIWNQLFHARNKSLKLKLVPAGEEGIKDQVTYIQI